MNTAEQIKKWLKSQDWFPQYVENVRKRGKEDADYHFQHLDDRAISCAFIWNRSREGCLFWEKADRQFKDWYNKKLGGNLTV